MKIYKFARRGAMLVMCLSVMFGSWGGPAWAGTITGSIQTVTGGPVANGTLGFTLSQAAQLAGVGTLVTSQVSCYTSSTGLVVGLPDPLTGPAVTPNTASGTLAAATYYVKVTFWNASGETVASPETTVVLSAQGNIAVASPMLQPASASGYKVYISSSSGTETLQTTVTGFAPYSQSTPLVSGAALPGSNTSVCSIYFSDTLVPTGTSYRVSLLSKNGTPVSGFPQTWCTYGGLSGTINVSNGAPTGNCSTNGVYYPTPIFAIPLPGGTQSITGTLNISQNLGVGGNLTTTGLGKFGSLNVTGSSSLAATSVLGTLTVVGKEALSNLGVFTNTQQNNYVTSAIGGINLLTAYSLEQAGNFSTDAISGGVLVPVSATVHQIDGLAGYVTSDCNSVFRNHCNTVGLYGQANDASASSNGVGLWGGNTVCQLSGTNGNCTGLEIDMNPASGSTPSYFVGLVLNGLGNGTPPAAYAPGANPNGGGSAAIQVVAPYILGAGGYRWPLGLSFSRGSVIGTAVQIDAPCLAAADPCDSALLTMTGYDGAHAAHTVPIRGDSKGDIVLGGPLKTEGTVPTCTFTSGGGTSPSCTLDTGSTATAGMIIATTGTGAPAGTGTITLTFAATIGVNKPVCMYEASDNGAGQWAALPVFKDKTPAIASDLFTWTNGAAPTALSTSSAYWINYHCWAK